MTLEIRINAHLEQGALKDQVDEAMAALGFYRSTTAHTQPATTGAAVSEKVKALKEAAGVGPVNAEDEAAAEPATFLTNTPRAGESEEQTAARRERGKPAPGRARRTKEEIAEDEAADKADAEASAARGSISTDPENRVGPEDEPEVQEQDKADEQAEVEATREPEKPLTVDDVKAAVGLYVKKFGLDAAQADGPALFVNLLGNPPEGEKFWRMSILPTDQAKLANCVKGWTAAAAADARYVAKAGA